MALSATTSVRDVPSHVGVLVLLAIGMLGRNWATVQDWVTHVGTAGPLPRLTRPSWSVPNGNRTTIGGRPEYGDDDGRPGETQPCRGKDRLVEILRDAKIPITNELCHRLPTWESVTKLFGEDPVVVGMETCPVYRSQLQEKQQAVPVPAVGGLYNTGTNALVWTLLENYRNVGEKDMIGLLHPYELPWGKHMEAEYRMDVSQNQNVTTTVLPIVLIRDPYRWMASVCKHSYDIQFSRTGGQPCPSLVGGQQPVGPIDNQSENNSTSLRPIPVAVKATLPTGTRIHRSYNSLADLWTQWNRHYFYYDYYNYSFLDDGNMRKDSMPQTSPRLMLRFEDLLFHTRAVYDKIVECLVGHNSSATTNASSSSSSSSSSSPTMAFHYRTEPSKIHGTSGMDDTFVEAMIRNGRDHGRTARFSDHDLQYARTAGLDGELMRAFRYTHPEPRRGY